MLLGEGSGNPSLHLHHASSPFVREHLLSRGRGGHGSHPAARLGRGGGGSGLSFAFQPVVWDQLTGGGLFLGVTQGTEVQPPPLLPGRPYTFELYLAYAVDDPENPRAYSVAADRQGAFRGSPFRGPA